ncbi:hypothetical protein H7R52_00025 [Weissella confusa]|uniref:Uncharacterized protein n=1 Tax=Weissella confusa TaxID=1583 RepID=A0A923SMI2_WEICO|nr:hypothetical protein [Weissella confusa]
MRITLMIGGIFALIGFILSVLPSDTLTGTGFIGRPKDQKLVFKEDYTDSSDDGSQPNVQGIENWKLMSELLSAPFTFIVVIIGILLALAMFLPNIALTIRRYRDAGTVTWVAWLVWIL